MRSGTDRSSATRDAILDAAEQLFAERGLSAVSNRQVSEAAGQGNNAAVGYHFGTKADLVTAIVRRHNRLIADRRRELVARIAGSDDPRDWISCWVRPATEHLDSLGTPTWYARFSAQVMADPGYHEIVVAESLSDPMLGEILEGLNRCAPPMPVEVRLQRNYMTRQLVVNLLADCERALAGGQHEPWVSWAKASTGLIDALVGLWLAPITPPPS
ncbi:TetR/AcrR family transcriptional regulator [Cryptosporangium aurantiacum]|uniref:Transcriptional regulator, TetR family n=1 Tax=Cryptosporangium aurantiacum TaxID=134849 RepID=A0A1M7TZH2_9ACTN|nr:TetR/AcrR family transcriptional regulator [Cryptosporangium aurantiacum]SHN76108.1 transcriptional regulator, TetR family [Cryptosporangium aurantiacum]